MDLLIVVCTHCYKKTGKQKNAVKRHVIREEGQRDRFVDNCKTCEKRWQDLVGDDEDQKPPGERNICTEPGCGRGFNTVRGMKQHQTVMKHKSRKKKED